MFPRRHTWCEVKPTLFLTLEFVLPLLPLKSVRFLLAQGQPATATNLQEDQVTFVRMKKMHLFQFPMFFIDLAGGVSGRDSSLFVYHSSRTTKAVDSADETIYDQPFNSRSL